MIVTDPQTYPSGTREYLTVTVTADVELDDQAVALTIDDQATWIDCTWQGDPGTTRKARTTAPLLLEAPNGFRSVPVLVRVTDVSEVPLIDAGYLNIAPA